MSGRAALTLAAIVGLGALGVIGASPAAAQRIAPPRNEAAFAADRWYGEDKVKHLAVSAAITGMAYGGSRIAFDSDESIGVAVGAAALAGLLREVHDHRLGKPFSFKDLAWDALGIAAGFFWIREIE